MEHLGYLEAETGSYNIYINILRSKTAASLEKTTMGRDKTEQRKSELKPKPCPDLSRQSLAWRGHDGRPLEHGCCQKGTREAAVFSFSRKRR